MNLEMFVRRGVSRISLILRNSKIICRPISTSPRWRSPSTQHSEPLNRNLLLSSNNEHYESELTILNNLDALGKRQNKVLHIAGGSDSPMVVWSSPLVASLYVTDQNPCALMLFQIKLGLALSDIPLDKALQFLGMVEDSSVMNGDERLELFEAKIAPNFIEPDSDLIGFKAARDKIGKEIAAGICRTGGLENCFAFLRKNISAEDRHAILNNDSDCTLLKRYFHPEEGNPVLNGETTVRELALKHILPPPAYEVLSAFFPEHMKVHNYGTIREVLRYKETKNPNFMLDLMMKGYYTPDSMPIWLTDASRNHIRGKQMQVSVTSGDIHDAVGSFDLISASNIYDWTEDYIDPIKVLVGKLEKNGALLIRRVTEFPQLEKNLVGSGARIAPYNNDVRQAERSFLFGGELNIFAVTKSE
eukprot:m.23315 g.23315  ORF g.23315 m.23315 type:complete len:417 (-) comp7488_c0_seq1:290-1540(-)